MRMPRKLTHKDIEERLTAHLKTRKSTLWGMWDLSQESSRDAAMTWVLKLCEDLEILEKSQVKG